MTFQQTPYTVLLLLSGGLSSLFAAYVFARTRRTRSVPSARPFVVATFAGAIWAIAYAFQVASATLPGKIFWSRFVWLGAATATTAWFVFVLAYTDRESWLTRRVLAALSVEPVATLLVVWTNDAHRLFVTDVWLADVGPFTMLAAEVGPFFPVHLAYSYLLNLVGLAFLVRFVLTVEDAYRRQALALLSGFAVTWTASVVTITGHSPVAHLDLTPLSFAVGNAVVAWALVRYDLFDVVPVALGTVMDTIPDGIVVLDSRGAVVTLNTVARSMLGDDAAVVGSPATDAFDRYPELVASFDRPDHGPVTIENETDDSRRFFETRTATIDDPRVGGQLLVLRDVTESRNAEIRFRTLIERSTSVVVILDEWGVQRYVSPSIERILGYRPADLEGTLSFDLVHPDDRESVVDAFGSVLEGEVVRVEFRIRHEDGTWRVFEAIASNMVDEPSIEGVVINARDVTSRRRYEQRLRVLNRVLRHDLRNDVNVIQGYSELLAERPGDQRRTEWTTFIQEKCEELVVLSEKARQIDYTLHREENAMEPVEIVGRLRETVETAMGDHQHVDFELPEAGPTWVYADPLIDSAIDNLVENAVQHSDQPNPRVEVSVSTTTVGGDPYVDVTVSDDGPGIRASERRVLDHGVETQLEHASGLGLWLVNWIVEASDGHLLFDENEPRGGVVTMRLRQMPPEDVPGGRDQSTTAEPDDGPEG